MTNRNRVLQFLQSISPNPATNAEIVSRTGIRPHPQVFQITQELMRRGLVEGRLLRKDWTFWAKNDRGRDLPERTISEIILEEGPVPNGPTNGRAASFEILARQTMSEHFCVDLRPKRIEQVRKKFDEQVRHAQLEQGVLKDNTLMPGEWYGGQLHFDPVLEGDRKFRISIQVGQDVHEIDVAHESVT